MCAYVVFMGCLMANLFNSFAPQILFQEVPDEVSLAYTITGCRLQCEGCHSQDTWDPRQGKPLTTQAFTADLMRYRGFITCVLFFGGEWQPDALIEKLIVARQHNLKTCLYTGLPKVSRSILQHLCYLKTGKWIASRGGLAAKTTNQKFIKVKTGELLNYKFTGE